MWFATYLYQQGLVSATDVLDAADRQLATRPPLGRLALELRMLTVKQVADVLGHQADENAAFGRLAVKLGYLSKSQIAELLMEQTDRQRSLADILVEMGAIDRATMIAELANARRTANRTGEPVTKVELATP